MGADHGHGHGHGHDHEHGHAADSENPHAGQGSVMLDIGGDVGALVVTMPRAMVGEEIDILDPADPHPVSGRPHVAVVERPLDGAPESLSVPSLVYPEVTEGRWSLAPKGTDDIRLTVEVRGGEVTSVDWPA